MDSWFNWAQNNNLGVGRMEDLILVTGCTLVASWAAAAFVDNTMDAEISLEIRVLSNGGASFVWSNIRGPVEYRNSRPGQVCLPGYVCLACTNLFRLKGPHHSGSMRLNQGIPSKTLPDQTRPSCTRTPY